MKNSILVFLILLVFSSCTLFRKTAKQELSDGLYTKKSSSAKARVYVNVSDDAIYLYPTIKQNNACAIDTLRVSEVYLPKVQTIEKIDFKLSQSSFDVDFFTIPFKLRFAEKAVPPQLNANINGAVYMGYRRDIYKINYRTNLLKTNIRKTNHFGYSLGFFTGFGNTFMSPTNTNNVLQQEYDGIVWGKGIAGIIGINNFTIGLTLGFDNLLDKNKSIWIYESRPWLGLAFGLNLN
jgi:hypothetical protein